LGSGISYPLSLLNSGNVRLGICQFLANRSKQSQFEKVKHWCDKHGTKWAELLHLFRQSGGNCFDGKVDEKISAKQPVQSLFSVSEGVFGDKELVLGLCFLGFDAKTVRLQSGFLLESALRPLIEFFKRMDRRALRFGLALRLE